MSEVNTGSVLTLIETNDIIKVDFKPGQLIIVSDGLVYYDPTFGTNLSSRICINPKQEVDVFIREDNKLDNYYLDLHPQAINGDMVIIKDIIPNTNRFKYTIYTYNSNDEDSNQSDWVKTTDALSTADIYIDKDIVITNQTDESGNFKVIKAGQSVTDVLEEVISPDKYPEIVKPSIILNFPEAGSYEVGTVVTPSYSVIFDEGNYEYGPETGVTIANCKINSNNGSIFESLNGSLAAIEVNENTNIKLSAVIDYSDGSIPLTVKGNEYPEGQIKANTSSAVSESIIGYVNGVYYGCLPNKITTTDITNEIIKGLNKTNSKYKKETIDFQVEISTQSIIIACPSNEVGIVKVQNNTVNAEMKEAFGSPIVIPVAGADNDLESNNVRNYNVWIYNPALPYENTADLTIHLG